jgi:hypothetical protein
MYHTILHERHWRYHDLIYKIKVYEASGLLQKLLLPLLRLQVTACLGRVILIRLASYQPIRRLSGIVS